MAGLQGKDFEKVQKEINIYKYIMKLYTKYFYQDLLPNQFLQAKEPIEMG